jgi:hypothetical protein
MPRRASSRALTVENADPAGVSTDDVDDLVDHDPRASGDVDAVPDRRHDDDGRDPLH